MRRTRWITPTRMLALLTFSVGLMLGCKDAVLPQERTVLDGLKPGIHPVVVLASQSGNTAEVQLFLRRVQVDAKVASYQGVMEFDTKVLTLSGAELPQGVMGAWNEVSPGKVRFAGAALDGVGDGAVLTLRFTTRGRNNLLADDFKVKMEEVVATDGFKNLSSEVVDRAHPLFSSTPL